MPDAPTLRYADALLHLKAVNEDDRTFEGIASTPSVDFGRDSMDPFGAKFALPMPFMWQHGKEEIKDPIGWITHATPSKDGIRVKGRFDDGKGAPPTLKEQLDRAFYLVKKKLVTGLSIGWIPVDGEPVKGLPGVVNWKKWIWNELSAVRIGMNSEATITAVKSMNAGLRATPGASSNPGVPGKPSNPARNVKIMKLPQLEALEQSRATKQARVDELKTKCGEDVSALEADERSEMITLGGELATIEEDISIMNTMAGNLAKAVAVTPAHGRDPVLATRIRYGDARMKSDGGKELPKGTLWTRSILARAWAVKNQGAMSDAAAYAKQAWPHAAELHAYLSLNPQLLAMQYKANPATGGSGNWAEVLNAANTIEGDFIDVLLPATIIGKLGMRPAAFNTKMLRRTTGSTSANWVGKAAAKPVGENVWDTVSVDQSKIADMIVLTDDQVMTSHIDSVEATRMDLVEQIQQFADEQFCSTSLASVAGTNPSGILYQVNDFPSNGATADDLYADLYALDNRFNAANIGIDQVTLIMSSFLASGISKLRTSLGVKAFDGFTSRGGDLDGKKTIISNNVGGSSTGSNLIAVSPRDILFAQNGGVRVDMSRDATIDMAGGNSPTFSLFQKNAMALRVEWWVSWSKARPEAAQYVSGAAYAPQPT